MSTDHILRKGRSVRTVSPARGTASILDDPVTARASKVVRPNVSSILNRTNKSHASEPVPRVLIPKYKSGSAMAAATIIAGIQTNAGGQRDLLKPAQKATLAPFDGLAVPVSNAMVRG